MDPPNKRRRLAPKVPEPAPIPTASATAAAAATVPTPATTPQQAQYSPEQTRQHFPVQEPAHAAERHDFESFARHLQDAAMLIYRKMEKTPSYTSASVLLLRWEEDTSVEHELVALEKVFREKYNYHTDKWAIPTVPNPSIKLGVQMAAFMDNARSDHLLIIYYAGHGYVGADKQLYWASNTREDACKLKWSGVRCLFEDASSDILLLLDTCAIHDAPVAGSHGVKQAIAAYSPGQRDADYHTHSFTTHLVESLRRLSSGRPFTAQRLYEEIMRQRHDDLTAKLSNGGAGKPPVEKSPTFFTLTPGKSQNLTLAPLRPGRTSAHDAEAKDASGSGPLPDLTFDEARVLVCTTFVGDANPDMMFYNQWLQQTPPIASKITMEGMFLGPPTMLLISMPQSIWNVFQHDKVCCFLGYINSHNMIDLYKGLVKSTPVPPVNHKAVEDGRILLEAREAATSSPASKRRHEAIAQQASSYSELPMRQEAPTRNPLPSSAPTASVIATAASVRDDGQDSAEMKEAAEQLKALSHVRHVSDGAASAVSDARQRDSPSSGANESGMEDVHYSADLNGSASKPKPAPPARKPLAKAQPKQDTRCTLCSHAPFKDSSSLRKHVAAAHTRPFPCAFSFAGCTSTFGSKNEWKRHIASQHLCLQYYRCSQCPSSAAEGKGNEFNRKDLFTQHLRRMHAPFAIKKALTKGDSKLNSEWENHVKEMQHSCLVTRREPPQLVSCPKHDCQKEFEGHIAWDEWTEHVGRHMEKGDGVRLGVDPMLAKWALDEAIIERDENGGYRFSTQNASNGDMDRRDSIVNSSFISDGGKLEEKVDKLDDIANGNKSEDNIEDDEHDPNSIVVATSTAMHDRMDTDD
ncbi:c2h2 finger domain-containing protein [Diaporthe amygdali]|uniref:c2h2 finger domain-containing protein n=1 Tax=Phomopsis amygdali TaxID=1214568 RepID=UPI0022FE01AD|nr:c2h2 finger domain-containing protein [Diaporthe amygdali]KAJ0120336.1 c2h2 finger domain-containing protein [Diaporthe amygdali]